MDNHVATFFFKGIWPVEALFDYLHRVMINNEWWEVIIEFFTKPFGVFERANIMIFFKLNTDKGILGSTIGTIGDVEGLGQQII